MYIIWCNCCGNVMYSTMDRELAVSMLNSMRESEKDAQSDKENEFTLYFVVADVVLSVRENDEVTT